MSLKEQEQYWTNRWEKNETGWHLQEPNPNLVANLEKVAKPNSNVFVPLCGKTVDLKYLRDRNFNAIGCELSELAVKEFFEELNEVPKKTKLASGLVKWEVPQICIYVGNIFDLENLGNIALVFDRASLVALPDDIRQRYVKHLLSITNNANQVLVTFEHTRNKTPPHSISKEMVRGYYDKVYDIELVGRRNVGDKIDEACYILTKRTK